MTFSIVARSEDGVSWGVAVASKFLAVGSAVPAASAGTGAIATQSFVNVGYKSAGLAHLGEGASAAETVRLLLEADEGREVRQVGVVDAQGEASSFTGEDCIAYAGGVTGDGYAIQGNMLTGEEVVAAMESAFLATKADEPLAERLLVALRAGDDAGGDARGRQSAAVLVVREGAGWNGYDDLEVELRSDDNPRPIDELDRLLGLFRGLDVDVPEDERTADAPELLVELDSRAQALGHRSFIVWMSLNNHDGMGGEDWTATSVVEELREATPDWVG